MQGKWHCPAGSHSTATGMSCKPDSSCAGRVKCSSCQNSASHQMPAAPHHVEQALQALHGVLLGLGQHAQLQQAGSRSACQEGEAQSCRLQRPCQGSLRQAWQGCPCAVAVVAGGV